MVIFELCLFAFPMLRNKTYSSVESVWHADLIGGRGRGLPPLAAGILHPTIPVWVEVEPGLTMLLDPRDLVQASIIATKQWEPGTWRSLSEHIGSGAVFVDVGAHVGYYSLKAAKAVGSGGRVLAIEPNPDTLQVLRANIAASGDSMITVEPVACSDSEGVLELFAASRNNTGATSLSRSNALKFGFERKSFRVRTRPLDALVQENRLDRVDVIKIDVEGAEILVLKGAERTLDLYHPVVTVELVEDQLKNMGTSSAEVIRVLRKHGYTPRHSYGAEDNNTEFAFAPGLPKASN